MQTDWSALGGVTAAVREQATPAAYYAVWHGTPDLMAVLLITTRSLAKARRIVAAMAAAGQPSYITTEQGCLLDGPGVVLSSNDEPIHKEDLT